jgi:hypothetical protein
VVIDTRLNVSGDPERGNTTFVAARQRSDPARVLVVLFGSGCVVLAVLLAVALCRPVGRAGAPGPGQQGTPNVSSDARLGPTSPGPAPVPVASRGVGPDDGGPGGDGPPTPRRTAAPPVERTVGTPGGSATCRCTGPTAYLVSWRPLTGFNPAKIVRGPAPTVSLVFDGIVLDIRLSFGCRDGVPVATTDTL